MAPLPTRKVLEEMKRVDLQRICKDYGVKANLKSEALIDLLLETQSTPVPQPTRRSVSTRHSSRMGPGRVTSMIVHDIEEEEEEMQEEISQSEEVEEDSPPTPPPVPPPRTRKGKELQTRLGFGKPMAAGGQGPRTVTRSSGTRVKRAKSSKSLKQTEPTIDEESETLSVPPKGDHHNGLPVPPSSQGGQHGQEPEPPASATLERTVVYRLLENAIRPLQDRIETSELEVGELRTMKTNLTDLQRQLAEFARTQKDMSAELERLRELPASVLFLKEEIKQLREGLIGQQPPSRPMTPKPKGPQSKHAAIGFGLPSSFKNPAIPTYDTQSNKLPSTSNLAYSHPGIAPTTLGKRRRDSISSNITGVVEDGDEDDNDLATKVIRPNKKRSRMQVGGDSIDHSARTPNSSRIPSQDEEQAVASGSNPGIPAFTVFRGADEPSDYLDPPPPTDHLPDLFHAHSPSNSNSNSQQSKVAAATATSSANAAENQPQAFNFSFLPLSSTPLNPMYMPSFPYPEPPQSPSPAGASLGAFMGRNQEERTDIFREFGLPSPARSSRLYGSSSGSFQEERGGFVDPAALMQQGSSGRQREVSSNEVAAGLGLTTVRTSSSSDPSAGLAEPPPVKRTMYGTELEGDTRFGDFGVEGVATGFWASGRF
ncbi:hypothetical protein B0H34DRAFT_792635 [Crassisporium funariophilum]|nr:hypothetical protein B0H34DRAFT_792635 [Crassisporium funariophilum]